MGWAFVSGSLTLLNTGLSVTGIVVMVAIYARQATTIKLSRTCVRELAIIHARLELIEKILETDLEHRLARGFTGSELDSAPVSSRRPGRTIN